MNYSLDKAHWMKNKIRFEEDEEIISVATYHKNPNVGQILLWKTFSPKYTAKYFVLLTNKLVIVVPLNNVFSFKPESEMYLSFEDTKIIEAGGALEVKVKEKSPFRIYPDTFANVINHVDMNYFINIIRSKKKKHIIQAENKEASK